MGESPGEESLADGVAVQAFEAKPLFGQIQPSRGPACRALNNKAREPRLHQ
jgi:hypothetical protein